MKAIVNTKYGSPDVLELKEVAKPIPKNNEVLIKIYATAVNSGDWRLRKADPYAVRLFFGMIKPKITILGGVLSGEIEAVGKEVTRYKVGDQIFGSTDLTFGAYAEFKCLPETDSIAIKPKNVSYTEAASIPFGAATALFFLRKAFLKPGQMVLIVGASGSVGSAAVQLAKAFGAIVTGVCSTSNLGLVKSLGSDYVIDYTKEDFTQNGKTYDVIFDTVKATSTFKSLASLSKNGIMILSAAGLKEMLQAIWIKNTKRIKIIIGVTSQNADDMNFLKNLIDEGKLISVIDRIYSLEQIAQAHEYVEKGHKKGNVAITIVPDNL